MFKIVFILDHKLMHYRLPFFNLLQSKGYDVTVIHSGDKLAGSAFHEIKITCLEMGPFFYRKLPNLNKFDIVVYMQNIRYLDFILNNFKFHRNYKLIHWGIGVSSSVGLTSSRNSISRFRSYLENYADGIVYYSDFPLQFLNKKNKEKTFVANNTIENSIKIDCSLESKDSFLFIGSLDNRKGLDLLLISFKQYLKLNSNRKITKLIIIGDGLEMKNIQKYISENHLNEHVLLPGRIISYEGKLPYFKRSIISVSPKQAGLAVLESFSFGVPFMTYKNAISGGEHLNVIDKVNGVLLDNLTSKLLVENLNWINNNVEDTLKLGSNAFKFFNEERNMESMVQSFINCFDRSLIE